jgi:hypothetical protein
MAKSTGGYDVIEKGKEKYNRKMATAGAKWKSGVEAGNYCERMTQIFGHRPEKMCKDYAEGIGAVSASEFQSAVVGKGEKWAERYRKAGSY